MIDGKRRSSVRLDDFDVSDHGGNGASDSDDDTDADDGDGGGGVGRESNSSATSSRRWAQRALLHDAEVQMSNVYVCEGEECLTNSYYYFHVDYYFI